MREHELSRKGAISRTLQVLDFEDNKERTEDSGPIVADERESLRRVAWGGSLRGGIVAWGDRGA
jgi:hypothetical protein